MSLSPEEIESTSLKDPLVYGISYIDLQQKRKWAVGTRPWLPLIYNSVNPYYIENNVGRLTRKLVIQKSTQCGMSVMAITKNLHFCDFWPVRTFYMLPRQQDVFDFVSTRVDPMITSSPRLADKRGVPDSNHVKCLGGSYLFFMEASVEPRMMPADALFADEVDLSDPTNVSTGRNRLDDSNWKLEYYFSTPTVSNYGINGLYHNSDMHRWIIKCRYCSHEQWLDWDQHLRVIGPASNPTSVFFGCSECNEEITRQDILAGQWIPEKPENGEDYIGFHISQMMYFPAAELYAAFRDPQTKLLEFYRKRLGMPYELGEGSLERDHFLINCFDEPYEPEYKPDGESRYYMGIDQGNQIQVVIGKMEPENNRIKVVHVELIPFEEGFPRVGQLMRIYKIRRAVGDANPNRHSMADLQKSFVGKLILADYTEQKPRYKITRTKKGKQSWISGMTIHRTQAIDALFENIRKGIWQLPGSPPNLSSDVELIIDHCTAMRRDIEMRKTPAGEFSVGVYRSIRADHLAHTLSYLQLAIDLDNEKRIFRHTVIGKDSDEEDAPDPNAHLLTEAISLLAEVPLQQLKDYMQRGETGDYQAPFPLSYKLKKVMDIECPMEIIKQAINLLIKDKENA